MNNIDKRSTKFPTSEDYLKADSVVNELLGDILYMAADLHDDIDDSRYYFDEEYTDLESFYVRSAKLVGALEKVRSDLVHQEAVRILESREK